METKTQNQNVISIFLKETSSSAQGFKEDYHLPDEIRKAKKNKQYKLYLSIVSFIALLFCFTYAANYYVNYKNNQVRINIQEFEDVNLTEMINLAKKNEEELNRVKMELEESQRNMEIKIKDTKAFYNREQAVIKAKTISGQEKKKLLAELKKKEWAALKKIEDQYQKEIDEKQKKVVIVKEKIVNYDKKLQENLKKSEKMLQDTVRKNTSVVNETRKIYEIGLSKQKNFYETKIAALNARYETENERLKAELKKLNLLLVAGENENKTLKTQKDETELKNQETNKNLTETTLILNQHRQELETVKKELDQSKQEKETTTQQYKTTMENLEKTNRLLSASQEYLQKYVKNMDLIAKKKKDQGYILEQIDTQKVIVVLNNVFTVKNGDLALVFDENSQYIATLKLLPESSANMEVGMQAEIVETVSDKSIEPFYKILIKYKTERKK